MAGMCLNGVRELIIPPKHGFGLQGLVRNGITVVPKNATLYYDVRLVELTAKKVADKQKEKDKKEKEERRQKTDRKKK